MGRVHIALFTNGYPHVDAAIRALDLSHRHGASFSRTIGEPLGLRRDQFPRWFVETDASHALLLEGDVVPPEAPDDAVDRLLGLNAPVATAAYPIVTDAGLVWDVKADGTDDWIAELPDNVFPVRHMGLGFAVIHRDVFARIRKPWFQFGAAAGGRVLGEDAWFSNGVKRAGLQILCDGSIRCSHFKDGLDLAKFAR